MSSYENKNNTLTKFGSNIRVLNTPMEQYVTEGELVEGLATKQDIMQYDVLPSASAENLGKIVQYVGATTVDYVNSSFYKCVAKGTLPETYEWKLTIYNADVITLPNKEMIYDATPTEKFGACTIEMLSDTTVRVTGAVSGGYQGVYMKVKITPNKKNIFFPKFTNINYPSTETGTQTISVFLKKPDGTNLNTLKILYIKGKTSNTTSAFILDFSLDNFKDCIVDDEYVTLLFALQGNASYDLSLLSQSYVGQGRLHDKKVIFMGDSITTKNYLWVDFFEIITECTEIVDTAYVGATLNDYPDTVVDGNPPSSSTDHKNTLHNQVQQIINNAYEAPDCIIIAIGTNGGLSDLAIGDMDATFEEADLTNLDLTTGSGAFRFCNETLANLYPNAKVFWCAPIQRDSYSVKDSNTLATNLDNLTSYGAVEFIDTMRCGIIRGNEASGHRRYLLDGTHPNALGSMLIAKYNANAISNLMSI